MEILVPLSFFAFLGAVILGPIYLNHRTRQAKLDLLRQAVERGQDLDPKILDQIYDDESRKPPRDRARRSLGSGVILTALACGLAAAAYMTDGFDPSGNSFSGMMVAAVIIGFLGVGFVILAIVDYATRKPTPPAGE